MTKQKPVVTFQLAEAEKQQLIQKSKELNMSVSQFVRGRALLDQHKINEMEKSIQRLTLENNKLQCLSGLEIKSQHHKNLLMKFTKDQIVMMTRLFTGWQYRENEKPLENTTMDSLIRNSIFEAIKENLIQIAGEKFPGEDFEDEIEDIFQEYEE